MVDWKRVPDYPAYEVSEDGQVRSSWHGDVRLLKPALSHWGYYVVNLWTDKGTKKQIKVHRLVCLLFNGKPPAADAKYVNHKDGVKTNNHYTNLEWVTFDENVRHASSTGLSRHSKAFTIRVHQLGQLSVEYEFAVDVCNKYSLTKQTLMALLSHYPKLALNREREVYTFEPLYTDDSRERVAGYGVRVKDCVTGSEYRTSTIVLAALKTGVSRFGIQTALGKEKLMNGYLFKEAADDTPFPLTCPSKALASRERTHAYWQKRINNL